MSSLPVEGTISQASLTSKASSPFKEHACMPQLLGMRSSTLAKACSWWVEESLDSTSSTTCPACEPRTFGYRSVPDQTFFPNGSGELRYIASHHLWNACQFGRLTLESE